jgi:hypothetical protein
MRRIKEIKTPNLGIHTTGPQLELVHATAGGRRTGAKPTDGGDGSTVTPKNMGDEPADKVVDLYRPVCCSASE